MLISACEWEEGRSEGNIYMWEDGKCISRIKITDFLTCLNSPKFFRVVMNKTVSSLLQNLLHFFLKLFCVCVCGFVKT